MTKRTVLNKGRFVSTKGTQDWACATEPDECVTPTSPKKPFNNKINSDKLQGGTEKTTIAGESIWIMSAKLGPTSLPPHEGVKGFHSQKPAHGPAWAITASQNVQAEGQPVVRVEDKTLQNWGNAHGEVMIVAKDVALPEPEGGGGGGRADGDSDRTTKKDAKDATGGRGDPKFPKSGEVPVPECEIIAVQAYCDHGNRWSKDGLLQVVVTSPRPHIVRLEAAVNGPCEKVTTHTHWSVLDGPTLPQGRLSVLEAMRPEPKLLSLQAFDTLLMRNKREYKLRCDSCKASNQTLKVEAYEPGTVVFTDAPIREYLRGELWKASIILGFFVGEAKVGHGEDEEVEMFEVLMPAGGRKDAIVGSMRVKEHTDHRAFVSIMVEFHAAPLFRFGMRISLVELVIDILMAVFTGGGGNVAKAGAKGGAKLALKNFIPALIEKSPAVARRIGTRVIRSGSELLGKYAPKWVKKGAEQLKSRGDKLGDMFGEHLQEAADMLADELKNLGKPPFDIYTDFSVRMDLDGWLKRSSPDEPLPVINGMVATVGLRTGFGAEGRAKMSPVPVIFPLRPGLQVSTMVEIWADHDFKMDLESKGIEIWAKGIKDKCQAHFKMELKSFLGTLSGQFDLPEAEVELGLPPLKLFPPPVM